MNKETLEKMILNGAHAHELIRQGAKSTAVKYARKRLKKDGYDVPYTKGGELKCK